jgi:glycosyltransferase involved in cell wall biosynthesis
MPPTVLIYCDQLLPYSATFVRSQAEALQNFKAYYVGCRQVAGLPLPAEQMSVINSGGMLGKTTEALFKLQGRVPAPLLQQLSQLQPALVHAHFGPDGLRALPLAQQLQIPLLVTFHGYDATVTDVSAHQASIGHRAYMQRRAVLQREAHSFIAVSEFIKSKLLEQGFLSEKIYVHYVGVDTDVFTPDPTIHREPLVLFVGRLVEKKGCDYLIRAMKVVQSVNPDAKLVVIGDGPLRLPLERLAKETLKRYQFLGVQPPEIVRSWMNRAKVFSVPSVVAASGDSEAFGIVFAEAQAMGVPVVSFASGGIPEAVANSETGFLAAERDWQGLAEGIIYLLKYETLWDKFSQTGQERVRSKFALKQQTLALEQIYRTILKR